MTMTATHTGRARALPTRERRPVVAALAVLGILLAAAGSGLLYTRAGAKTPCVVTRTKVAAGHVLTREDLTTVGIAGEVTAISGRDLGEVVGQRAATTLMPGTPVQRSDLSSSSGIGPGQAQVGVSVSSAQAPAGVGVGDTVEVLQLRGTDASSSGPASVLVASAVVWSVHPDPDRTGGILLTLTVPAQQVLDIATASGAGLAAVVRLPAGQ